MKYAVKVPFDGSMLYVMECDGETVMLCDTKEEADKRAPIWGDRAVVVEYPYCDCGHELDTMGRCPYHGLPEE